MRVELTKQAGSGGNGDTQRRFEPVLDEHDTESRALVVVEPNIARAAPLHYRPAAFLAHLIATKEQLPQTCERRRADPAEAIAAYRAVEAITKYNY